MKTRDLIEQLQQADPTGEAECVVGCDDIYFVSNEPMHYDGAPCLLIRDESKKPFYHVAGARYEVSGRKVQFHTMGLEDILGDHHDAPVTFGSEEQRAFREPRVEAARAKSRAIDAHVEEWSKARKHFADSPKYLRAMRLFNRFHAHSNPEK